MEYYVSSLKKLTNRRWLVSVNYEPAFALYTGELRRLGIAEDAVISEENYAKIEKLLSKRATVRAMALLKDKDYVRKELISKLEGSYYTQKAIDDAISYIDRYGYLDDYRYASNYISFKAPLKSKRQIEQKLLQKGVSRDIVQKACEEYYSDNEDTELKQLVEHMERKLSKKSVTGLGADMQTDIQKFLTYEDKQKIMGYYIRRGFSTDIVKKALDIVVSDGDDN